MGWDKDLPIADQKLNTLASTITDGWDAIQEADETSGTPIYQKAILLGDRTTLGGAADPTVVGATTYIYSKGATQELYMRDAASNIIQLSNAGKIGATDVNYEADSITFDGTIIYNENNFVNAWAKVSSIAGIDFGSGVDSATVSSGSYTVTLSANVTADANYVVIPTALGTNAYCTVDASYVQTTTKFKVNRRSNDGTASAGAWQFIVIGL